MSKTKKQQNIEQTESNLIPCDLPSTEKPITITGFKIEYSQEKDCCSTEEDLQFLNISIEDGGGGTYFVIETKRWAFDNIEELINILKDFQKRI